MLADFLCFVENQGFSLSTQVALLLHFIESRGLTAELGKYMAELEKDIELNSKGIEE